MNILNIAIKAAGSKKELADTLGVTPPNVNNWEKRGMPHMVERAIKSLYSKEISKAKKAEKAKNEQEA